MQIKHLDIHCRHLVITDWRLHSSWTDQCWHHHDMSCPDRTWLDHKIIMHLHNIIIPTKIFNECSINYYENIHICAGVRLWLNGTQQNLSNQAQNVFIYIQTIQIYTMPCLFVTITKRTFWKLKFSEIGKDYHELQLCWEQRCVTFISFQTKKIFPTSGTAASNKMQ